MDWKRLSRPLVLELPISPNPPSPPIMEGTENSTSPSSKNVSAHCKPALQEGILILQNGGIIGEVGTPARA